MLATPTTVTLSVILTFTSLPSRVLMPSIGPSTASMVPRMRTGGACCAQATVVRTDTAASAAVIQDVSFDMALPLGFLRPTLGNPGERGVFRVSPSFRDDATGSGLLGRPDDKLRIEPGISRFPGAQLRT